MTVERPWRPSRKFFAGFLANSAAGTEMNVNGASTPVAFDLVVKFPFEIATIFILLQDSGTTALDKFMTLAALPVGLDIHILGPRGVVVSSFTAQRKIKTLAALAMLTGTDTVEVIKSTSISTHLVQFSFPTSRFQLERGFGFRVVVNDDLSALRAFHILLRGVRP